METSRDQMDSARESALEFFSRSTGANPWQLRDELGKVMWERVGIVRSGKGLKQAIEELRDLSERAAKARVPGGPAFNLTWQQALDLRNMLTASTLIARSALTREDSRGAHYREDFPDLDNGNWLKNIYVRREGAEQKFWTEPVKLSRLKP
jgi:succinate dehydrogenase/fumarate reductase flavoprotein subunit